MILGIPTSLPNIGANILLLSQQYLGFSLQSTTGLMTPVFGLGSMLIIVLGIYKLIRTRESTQSYLIIIWLICLIPIIVTNPNFTSVTFLPLVLLLATGLENLLGYWYRLFPFNPYARLTGLIPLIVLVSVLVLSGLERYIYGYHYDPYTVANFSQDLSLLPKGTKQLVVSSSEVPFYQVVAEHRKGLIVENISPDSDSFTVSHDANISTYPTYKIQKIITSSATVESDRFYIYKKTNL